MGSRLKLGKVIGIRSFDWWRVGSSKLFISAAGMSFLKSGVFINHHHMGSSIRIYKSGSQKSFEIHPEMDFDYVKKLFLGIS